MAGKTSEFLSRLTFLEAVVPRSKYALAAVPLESFGLNSGETDTHPFSPQKCPGRSAQGNEVTVGVIAGSGRTGGAA